jgi:hypothetical protein
MRTNVLTSVTRRYAGSLTHPGAGWAQSCNIQVMPEARPAGQENAFTREFDRIEKARLIRRNRPDAVLEAVEVRNRHGHVRTYNDLQGSHGVMRCDRHVEGFSAIVAMRSISLIPPVQTMSGITKSANRCSKTGKKSQRV